MFISGEIVFPVIDFVPAKRAEKMQFSLFKRINGALRQSFDQKLLIRSQFIPTL
jgi:hypothetical protein